MPEQNDPYQLNITPELIEQYVQGRLDGKTMHAIERRALDDPFLAEALEGFERRAAGQSPHLDDLRARLQQRIGPDKDKKTFLIRLRNAEIAAAAVLALLIGLSLFFFTNTPAGYDKLVTSRDRRADGALQEARPATPGDTAAPRDLAGHRQPDAAPSEETAARIPEDLPAGQHEGAAGSVAVVSRQASAPARAAGLKEKSTPRAMIATGKAGAGNRDTVLITGIVRDEKSGEPLPGASVRVPGTPISTVSNASGQFTLALPEQPGSLAVAYIGYRSRQLAAERGTAPLAISLQPDDRALHETVVVGYAGRAPGKKALVGSISAKADAMEKNARPAGGMAAFRQYLRDSLRYPPKAVEDHIEGIVKLSFIVAPDSTPRQIRVIRGLGHGCDREAVRLLQNGPKWIPAGKDSAALQETTISFILQDGGN